ELSRRRGDPAALFRGAWRDPPGALRGQAARRRARAHDPRVPARGRRHPPRRAAAGIPRSPDRRSRLRRRRPTAADGPCVIDPILSALETRVLVLAPTGRDAPLIETVLLKAGIASTPCADVDSLCRALAGGAGAALVAEEAIDDRTRDRLIEFLAHQPPWS